MCGHPGTAAVPLNGYHRCATMGSMVRGEPSSHRGAGALRLARGRRTGIAPRPESQNITVRVIDL
jgi:hypothetical protein